MAKRRIIEHLKQTGHEPIDCGALRYDAATTPGILRAAATLHCLRRPGSRASCWADRAARDRRQRSLRAGLSVRTAALTREHNNAH